MRERKKQLNITEYLACRIADDKHAMRQAQSLIDESGYEALAAERLHEWVGSHMSVLLSQQLCRNPYPTDWLDWMQQVMVFGLDQVNWNELVNRLRGGHPVEERDPVVREHAVQGGPVVDIQVPCYLRLVDPDLSSHPALLYVRRGTFGPTTHGFRVFLFPDVPKLPIDEEEESRASVVINTTEKQVIVYDGDVALEE
jgi:hypothetical protein